MKSIRELLILKSLPRVGNSKINSGLCKLIKEDAQPGSFEKALIAKGFSETEIKLAGSAADSVLEQLELDLRFKAYTIFDEEYPRAFNDLGLAKPVVIYALGNIEALKDESLGIIGTRHPSDCVMEKGPLLVSEALEKKLAIVSGLAIGCDTIGHETAIRQNARTIAVLPCGFLKLTKAKARLCEEIVNCGGLVISEYPPLTEQTRFTPVQRDALIAALSQRIISLQCGEKSGTMHTLEYAYKMGRPIACYMPEKAETKGADFTGHDFAIAHYFAKPVESFSDLELFLSDEGLTANKKEKEICEQLSIF